MGNYKKLRQEHRKIMNELEEKLEKGICKYINAYINPKILHVKQIRKIIETIIPFRRFSIIIFAHFKEMENHQRNLQNELHRQRKKHDEDRHKQGEFHSVLSPYLRMVPKYEPYKLKLLNLLFTPKIILYILWLFGIFYLKLLKSWLIMY